MDKADSFRIREALQAITPALEDFYRFDSLDQSAANQENRKPPWSIPALKKGRGSKPCCTSSTD